MKTPLTLRAWATGRRDNCLRIADGKCGDDRAGWLEDAEYFNRVLLALEAQDQMLKLLEAARHCFKSYEFHNSATEPARDMAARIEEVLKKNGVEVRF